jgi:hypothetical protein
MRGVTIPHELNGEDQFILGLFVTWSAALVLGAACGRSRCVVGCGDRLDETRRFWKEAPTRRPCSSRTPTGRPRAGS